MPQDAMPLYDSDLKYGKKANKILALLFEMGTLGHNREESYRSKKSKQKSYWITFWRRCKEFVKIFNVFPVHAFQFFLSYTFRRFRIVSGIAVK